MCYRIRSFFCVCAPDWTRARACTLCWHMWLCVPANRAITHTHVSRHRFDALSHHFDWLSTSPPSSPVHRPYRKINSLTLHIKPSVNCICSRYVYELSHSLMAHLVLWSPALTKKKKLRSTPIYLLSIEYRWCKRTRKYTRTNNC